MAAILSYMVLRSPVEGPLFHFQNGNPLTRQRLVTKMREVLQTVGIDCSKYSGIASGLELPQRQQQRDSEFSHKDHRQMGECNISAVHQNTPGSATLSVPGIARN